MDINDIPAIRDKHPLDVAATMVGGRSELAKKLNVTVAAIGNWKQRGVPIECCVKIEVITERAIGRRILRPTDWRDIWPELAQAHANTAPAATQDEAQGVVNV